MKGRRADKSAPPTTMSAPSSYSPTEVAAMTDATLIAEFSRLTGCEGLICLHCTPKKPAARPLESFTLGIRAVASKKTGLTADIKLPKTCNNQKKANDARNPIENPFRQLIKKATDDEERAKLKEELKAAVAAAGLNQHRERSGETIY